MKNYATLVSVFLFSLIFSIQVFAGQTGKISGYVLDSQTGDAVIGANIVIEGTYLGAAADVNGYYFINNITPGTYTVMVSAVGYTKTKVTEVVVKIDLTTNLDVKLTSEAISLDEEVVVTAQRPLMVKDLTSTKASVSSSDIKMMPVENMNQVINLQAGVVDGHFRGGRTGEVAYLIDGIPVNDAYNGNVSVQVENNSIRELEIISGTFNAEYGQAMSGIVNIVTKEGSQKYEGGFQAYAGSYMTGHTDIFRHLDKVGSNISRDFQFNFSGPVKLLPNFSFFLTGRYVDDDGYYFGTRVYNIDDALPKNPTNTPAAYLSPTGDGEAVPMQTYKKYSFNGNLTYSLPKWKINYSMFFDNNENKYYNHGWSWSPDGLKTHYRENLVLNLHISFFPSNATYSSLKFSSNLNRYKGYLYENESDANYIDPMYGNPTSGYTFRQGGNEGDRYRRQTLTYTGLWSLESQVSKEHKIKVGIEGRYYDLYNHGKSIVNLTEGQVDDNLMPIFTLGYRQEGTSGNQSYRKNPYTLAAYVQDKMEYDILIINAGVRFDYFNSNSLMPADDRNPSLVAPNPSFPGFLEQKRASAKMQASPRLGFSFPISNQGAIHFSYGHFFQIPQFQYLYVNDEHIISSGQSLSSITGNPDLEAERTVKYELGLQQVVFPNVALNLSVYYSDIRNLLGMEIINTYEGFKYAKYINKDYANVKGLIIGFDKRFADYFGGRIDYTYQIAEGNSSDPMTVYNNNQSDPPVEPEKKVVPLNWDQQSTLNITANFGKPGDWTVGLVFQYGSGRPYTEDIRISNGVRFENGGRIPTFWNIDLRADKVFNVFGLDVRTFLLVYNLFDIKNEVGVYSTTGRAGIDLNTQFAGEINGLNNIEDYVNNPGQYSAPRQIKVGLSLEF